MEYKIKTVKSEERTLLILQLKVIFFVENTEVCVCKKIINVIELGVLNPLVGIKTNY